MPYYAHLVIIPTKIGVLYEVLLLERILQLVKLIFSFFLFFVFNFLCGDNVTILWSHWYSLFGLQLAPPMGFKARVGALWHALSITCAKPAGAAAKQYPANRFLGMDLPGHIYAPGKTIPRMHFA